MAALAVVAIATVGCGGPEPVDEPPIRVGVGSTVEQRVLAGLTEGALEAAGAEVVLVPDLGDTLDVRGAALEGDIDLFWDYTGAAWSLALGRAQPAPDPEESFEAVQSADRANGLRWVAPTGANATLAIFVRGGLGPDGEAATMTWLAGQLATAEGGLCADRTFLQQPTGFPALADAYAISTDVVTTTPLGEEKAITAVAAGECYAGLATATSGQAATAGLVPVRDDQQVFPAFVIAPVVRAGGVADTPQVTAVLEDLAAGLDTATVAALNARVAAGEDPGGVAEAHLAGTRPAGG